MRDRRDMIRLHLQNGVTDLKDIRESYNSYAEGGNVHSGEQNGSNYLSPIQPKSKVVNYGFVPESYLKKHGSIHNKNIQSQNQQQGSGILNNIQHNVSAIYNNLFNKPEPSSIKNIRYNLSNADVGLFTGGSEPQNAKAVLFNEFVENNPNTVRKKKDFINTTDTLLGDKKIPLSNIHNFYGLEDGRFKVGNINEFNDNTTIVPIRSKDLLIDSISYHPDKLDRPAFTQDDVKAYRSARIDIQDRFAKEHPESLTKKPNPIFLDKLFGNDKFAPKDSLEKYYPRTMQSINKLSRKIAPANNQQTNKFEYFYKGKKLNSNDVNSVVRAGKFILNSPETDNSTFYSLNNDDIRAKQLQEYINKNGVARPIMVDNGRYRNYIYDNSPRPFSRYGSMDYMRDNQNVFYTKQ